MKDNFWGTIYIILGVIIVIMVAYILISISPIRHIDCERIQLQQQSSNTYTPLPKQCEEGEQHGRN